jgi:glycosyltransferase involved in cell wall biosynthesis
LKREKGHKYLIRAAKEVVEKFDNTIFILIGDGPEKKNLIKELRKFNLGSNFIMKGKIPHNKIPLWMNACNILILPSISESFGVVQIEAMACGKPVVATYNGGSEDIIVNDELGILVSSQNSRDLSRAIQNALTKKWDENKIIEHSKKYRWNKISNKITQIHNEILKES